MVILNKEEHALIQPTSLFRIMLKHVYFVNCVYFKTEEASFLDELQSWMYTYLTINHPMY